MGDVVKFGRKRPQRMAFTRGKSGPGNRKGSSFIQSPAASALAAVMLAGSYMFYGQPMSVEHAVSGRFDVCQGGFRQNCVVDGDTVWLGGSKIRLSGIDAPEISDPACSREAELGHRAKWRLVELMNEGAFDVVRDGWRDSDIYGRKLRQLHRNGRSLGSILVEEGLAREWPDGQEQWCA